MSGTVNLTAYLCGAYAQGKQCFVWPKGSREVVSYVHVKSGRKQGSSLYCSILSTVQTPVSGPKFQPWTGPKPTSGANKEHLMSAPVGFMGHKLFPLIIPHLPVGRASGRDLLSIFSARGTDSAGGIGRRKVLDNRRSKGNWERGNGR